MNITPLPTFTTIALVGRSDLAAHRDYFHRVCQFLKAEQKKILYCTQLGKVLGVKSTNYSQIKRKADLIIVFGGDGTLLRHARQLYGAEGVFLGVQLKGTLGFLTEHHPEKLTAALTNFFRGRGKLNERILLAVTVYRRNQVYKKIHALNEIVISQTGISRLIRLPLSMDGQEITTYLADGVIMATPTGSTAYSLSAGGPIIYPSLHSFILTPISPHILANRPIVIPDDRTITAIIKDKDVTLTADGQTNLTLLPNDTIELKKADWRLRVIHSLQRNYFQILREKLNWGERGC